MTFGERITKLRIENGYPTRKMLAEKMQIPETTLRNYEKDEREPGHPFLIKLSSLFDVSIDWLLGISDEKEKTNSYQLTRSQYEHIRKYQSLDEHGTEIVDFILQKEYERTTAADDLAPVQYTRYINYYYRLASAGTGQIVFDMPPIKRIEIPDSLENRRVDYAIGVNGNSMEPVFYDGDTLLVEMTDNIERCEIGIFIVDGESFVKKLGDGELISLNPAAPNKKLNETARCVGRVLKKL